MKEKTGKGDGIRSLGFKKAGRMSLEIWGNKKKAPGRVRLGRIDAVAK